MYLKKVYNEDPHFSEAKVVYSDYEQEFDRLDPDLIKKIGFDGVAPEDLELIQDPTLDNLNKLAIQYSDAVIHGHDNVAPEIASFINDTGTLSVENKGGDIFINDVAALYEEVLEGKSILVEE
jgi:starch synthase